MSLQQSVGQNWPEGQRGQVSTMNAFRIAPRAKSMQPCSWLATFRLVAPAGRLRAGSDWRRTSGTAARCPALLVASPSCLHLLTRPTPSASNTFCGTEKRRPLASGTPRSRAGTVPTESAGPTQPVPARRPSLGRAVGLNPAPTGERWMMQWVPRSSPGIEDGNASRPHVVGVARDQR